MPPLNRIAVVWSHQGTGLKMKWWAPISV